MRRQAVPNQNNGTAEMVVNLAQEGDQIFRMCVMVKQLVVEAQPIGPGRAADRRQRTDPVVAIPRMLDGRMALRGPHSASQRLQ